MNQAVFAFETILRFEVLEPHQVDAMGYNKGGMAAICDSDCNCDPCDCNCHGSDGGTCNCNG